MICSKFTRNFEAALAAARKYHVAWLALPVATGCSVTFVASHESGIVAGLQTVALNASLVTACYLGMKKSHQDYEKRYRHSFMKLLDSHTDDARAIWQMRWHAGRNLAAKAAICLAGTSLSIVGSSSHIVKFLQPARPATAQHATAIAGINR